MRTLKLFGKWTLIVMVSLVVTLYLFNASWRAAAPDGQIHLLAHRGVHQTFDMDGVENNSSWSDCRASLPLRVPPFWNPNNGEDDLTMHLHLQTLLD